MSSPATTPLQLQTTKNKSVNKELFIDGYFYNVSRWSVLHPGGKVINYYTEFGEDASTAFQQFHNRSFNKVSFIKNSLPRRIATPEELKQFSRNKGMNRNEELTEGLRKLHNEFEKEGLFKPSLSHVIFRFLEYFVYFITSLFIFNCSDLKIGEGNQLLLRIFGILTLTMSYGRAVWLGHEGGHLSLTGHVKLDNFLQYFIYGFGNGLSASWWNHNHIKHHAMPQRIKRDVDLDTLPLIAFSAKVVGGSSHKKKSQARNIFIKYQSILFLPLHTFLVVLRWSFHLHPKYCLHKGKYMELGFMALHFLCIFQIGVINFLISKWLWGMYMFGNFSLSHTHLDTEDGPRHWVEYGFEHTINITSSRWMNWWMGYLNFQIEHHLFPTMPQFRNPLIQNRVRDFAKEFNLPYREYCYWEAIKMTFQNLQKVSNELVA